MSDSPKPKTPSTEHPIKEEVRRRMAAFEGGAIPEMQRAKERLEQVMQGVPALAPPTPASAHRVTEWTITIRGRGPHHNAAPGDANRLAAKFIAVLRANGHDVVSASFDNGVEEDIVSAAEPDLEPAP